ELHRVAGLECGVRCCLAEIPHESRHQRTTRTFRAEVAFHGVDLAVPEQWLVAVLAFPFAPLPQTGLILFLGVWQVAREALELDGEAPGVRVRAVLVHQGANLRVRVLDVAVRPRRLVFRHQSPDVTVPGDHDRGGRLDLMEVLPRSPVVALLDVQDERLYTGPVPAMESGDGRIPVLRHMQPLVDDLRCVGHDAPPKRTCTTRQVRATQRSVPPTGSRLAGAVAGCSSIPRRSR